MKSWTEKEDALQKTYSFADFTTAMAFMVKASYACEKLNHHPEWTNVYNRLHVKLNTHDAGNTVTEKDHRLAALLDEVYLQFK